MLWLVLREQNAFGLCARFESLELLILPYTLCQSVKPCSPGVFLKRDRIAFSLVTDVFSSRVKSEVLYGSEATVDAEHSKRAAPARGAGGVGGGMRINLTKRLAEDGVLQ